jgi:hypothetical protein
MRILQGLAVLAVLLLAVLYVSQACKGQPVLWIGPIRAIGC